MPMVTFHPRSGFALLAGSDVAAQPGDGAAGNTSQMRALQESVYSHDVDYTIGSPHLSHWRLRTRLVELLRRTIRNLSSGGAPPAVLEIGAGHGGYTEVALAMGARVTAVEMSQPSLDVLMDRFGTNDRFTGAHDPDGSLHCVGGGFALVLAVSVLHHIPDYVSFVRAAADHVAPGGTILTFQDPLFYPRMPAYQHAFDRAAYLGWRLGQGRFVAGANSLRRRITGHLDESQAGDMVEYHVVRRGVDELAIRRALAPRFERVEILPYWSNQSTIGQWLGERANWANTFAIDAGGRR